MRVRATSTRSSWPATTIACKFFIGAGICTSVENIKKQEKPLPQGRGAEHSEAERVSSERCSPAGLEEEILWLEN